MKNRFIKGLRRYTDEVKQHKGVFAVYVILRALVIAVGVFSFFSGNYQNLFLCILSLILFLLPASSAVDKGHVLSFLQGLSF